MRTPASAAAPAMAMVCAALRQMLTPPMWPRAIPDRAFTLGQSLMPGINALLLGTLMYRSGLVPRVLPVIGLIGAPLHITAVVLTMFGFIDRVGSVALIAALPIAVWEFSLGVYLVVKGFKPCPITDAMLEDATPPVYRDVVA
jgi:hypothetical protein